MYESKTDFPKTNELRIDGIFSVMTNTTAKSTLLSVYDADDKFAFQLMINQGELVIFARSTLKVGLPDGRISRPIGLVFWFLCVLFSLGGCAVFGLVLRF